MIQVACRLNGNLTRRIVIRTASVSVIPMGAFWTGIKVALACLAGEEKTTGITTVVTITFRLAARFPIVARQRRPSDRCSTG